MKPTIAIVLLVVLLFSCKSSEQNEIKAEEIVKKAIEISGKSKLKYAELEYVFRDYEYTSSGKCDHYVYTRSIKKNDSVITDVYNTREEIKRFINGKEQVLADTTAFNYAESINSVNYFIQLPLRLTDQAVIKDYLGIDTIKGKAYYNIKVRFSEENGGTDFQDIYNYWFATEDYKLDYLAYSFTVNGGGIRFREAYNERIINGIRFVDYKNYKPKDAKTTLDKLPEQFNKDGLELLSKIENSIKSINIGKKKC
jgi:hypothetical protein